MLANSLASLHFLPHQLWYLMQFLVHRSSPILDAFGVGKQRLQIVSDTCRCVQQQQHHGRFLERCVHCYQLKWM